MELEKCPICGTNEAVMKTGCFSFEMSQGYKIYCTKCFLQTGWYPTENLAVKAWNTRVSPWIRCETDELPDRDKIMKTQSIHVLVAHLWHNEKCVCEGYYYFNTKRRVNLDIYELDAIAWMPIPEFRED